MCNAMKLARKWRIAARAENQHQDKESQHECTAMTFEKSACNIKCSPTSFVGFDYVVVRPEKPRVCFGSTIERECVPKSGPAKSPFMRLHMPLPREFPGPGDYHKETSLIKQYASKVGYSSFVNKNPRNRQSSSSKEPERVFYDLDVRKPTKQVLIPFGVSSKRTGLVLPFPTPCPGTYSTHEPKRKKEKVCMAFGCRRLHLPAVPVLCSPFNLSLCSICGQTPIGDYWRRFADNVDVCRPCMKKNVDTLKQCSTKDAHRIRKFKELQKFSLVRYCGFFHNHNGTKAALQLMSRRTLRCKIQKENYLTMFGL